MAKKEKNDGQEEIQQFYFFFFSLFVFCFVFVCLFGVCLFGCLFLPWMSLVPLILSERTTLLVFGKGV